MVSYKVMTYMIPIHKPEKCNFVGFFSLTGKRIFLFCLPFKNPEDEIHSFSPGEKKRY